VGELLMVDDGSTDDSREVVGRLASSFGSRVRDLTSAGEGNRGAHVRLNQLVAAARCDWIAVLNSDDAFMPGRFELLRARLRCHDAEFACGQLLIMDEQGATRGTKRGIEQPEYPFPAALPCHELARDHDLLPLLCSQNFIATTSNMVFTRVLYERVGGFRDFRFVHDWDFALRAAASARCLYLPHFLSIYRSHASNSIKTDRGVIRDEVCELFRAFRSEFAAVCASPEARRGLEGNRYLDPSH